MRDNIITYAIKEGKPTHISEVDSGISCGCFCPSCNSPLVAKKGKIKIHHFAHFKQKDCEGAFESALHIGAKHEIQKHGYFMIPKGNLVFDSNKESIKVFDAMKIPIEKVHVERNLGHVRPDILIETEDKFLAIEIYVTHEVNKKKIEIYRNLGISAIEIDLSELHNTNQSYDLAELVVTSVENKKWIFNKLIHSYYKKFEEFAVLVPENEIFGGYACPLKLYYWKGIPSARWLDCLYCEFCYSVQPVLCLGESYISEISDFKKSIDIRKKEWEIKRATKLNDLIKKRWCPLCGNGRLELRYGRFVKFMGCTNYPNCKFKISEEKHKLIK